MIIADAKCKFKCKTALNQIENSCSYTCPPLLQKFFCQSSSIHKNNNIIKLTFEREEFYVESRLAPHMCPTLIWCALCMHIYIITGKATHTHAHIHTHTYIHIELCHIRFLQHAFLPLLLLVLTA